MQPTVFLKAAQIHASMEEDFYLVVFSQDESRFTRYAMLQRAYVFDEEDAALGLDGEYFELNGPERGGFKRVEKAVLGADSITFTMKEFFGVGQIVVDFCAAGMSEAAAQYLKRILGGKLQIG